jgi:hypothetical protein
MRWPAFGTVISAVLVAGGAGATPVPVEYVQETWYSFTYHAPYSSIHLWEHEPSEEFPIRHHDAYYSGETSGEYDLLSHIVVERGLLPLELSGRTVSFSSTGPRHYGNDWYDAIVHFGEDNTVQGWELQWVQTVGTTVLTSTHEGYVPDLSAYYPLHDAWLAAGKTVYDHWYWEPNDYAYSTRPGRWSVSAGHSCYTTVGGEYQGDTACVMPAPLPFSGLALLSALASLVMIGKRRAWPRRMQAAA